jgi:deazaflavin-dependent oxidoreductase (nitroreductase family)
MKIKPPSVFFFKTLFTLGLGPLVGRMILLLTTRGRKTGLPRVTALQYEMKDGDILLGSSLGVHADWYRNILADPHVTVRYKEGELKGLADPCSDPALIADFLEYRLKIHPKMVGAILRSEGLPAVPSRRNLEEYASTLAMVTIRLEKKI